MDAELSHLEPLVHSQRPYLHLRISLLYICDLFWVWICIYRGIRIQNGKNERTRAANYLRVSIWDLEAAI